MAGKRDFRGISKMYADDYMTFRMAAIRKDRRHEFLRKWLSSIAMKLTVEELEELLIHLYSDMRSDVRTLEILTRQDLVAMEERVAVGTTRLRFRDRDKEE